VWARPTGPSRRGPYFGVRRNAISNNRPKPTAAARLLAVVSLLINDRFHPHYGLRQNTAPCRKVPLGDPCTATICNAIRPPCRRPQGALTFQAKRIGVLRLIDSSNLVGACTGRSLGNSPRVSPKCFGSRSLNDLHNAIGRAWLTFHDKHGLHPASSSSRRGR
jgi:hypothetical protein